jgi:SAM-dependent methyltransferase
MSATATQKLRGRIAENGLRWTSYYALRAVSVALARLLEGRMASLERRHGLPGANSVAQNRERWEQWDWSRRGEEWTVSEEWKDALVDHLLLRHIRPGGTVLEIGPGGGHWSEVLRRLAERLVLVDLSAPCIELCRERFRGADNVDYFVNDGRSLPFLEDATIDSVWSFDVFVHVSAPDTESYVAELARVMRPGGAGVIHHPGAGATYQDGWRSNTTAELFGELLARNGLTATEQFDSWGPDGRFDVRRYGDVITVFKKD